VLNVPVGDESERVFAQALAIDPSRRPRDAGELWGMLKHAMQVDARSGRPPSLVVAGAEDSPSTLRMKDRSSSGFAPGGTLRMDPPTGRRSASELLAATPVPPVSSLASGETPLPPLPALSAAAVPGQRPSLLPVPGPIEAVSQVSPQPRRPRLLAAMLLVFVVIAIAGVGWRVLQRPTPVPAVSP
jgi:hypothetical protein